MTVTLSGSSEIGKNAVGKRSCIFKGIENSHLIVCISTCVFLSLANKAKDTHALSSVAHELGLGWPRSRGG